MIFEDNPEPSPSPISTIKRKVPRSILDYHDYVIELELPDEFKDTKEICVKERGGKFTVDTDCTHGNIEEITEK